MSGEGDGTTQWEVKGGKLPDFCTYVIVTIYDLQNPR